MMGMCLNILEVTQFKGKFGVGEKGRPTMIQSIHMAKSILSPVLALILLLTVNLQASSTQPSNQDNELSLVQPAAGEATSFTSTLVKITDMAAISPPSPDPSGITYLPNSNTLLVVDAEVDETAGEPPGITHFQGANVWELTLSGGLVRTANISKQEPTVTPMTNEPSGITWNPFTGHYYVSQDNGTEVYDLNPGLDGLIGTADDSWTNFDTLVAGNSDPEGVAYDTWRNRIFVADGSNDKVFGYTPGGVLTNQFDVGLYGIDDPESVEFSKFNGTLFVMSRNRDTPWIIETTATGTLLQTIDISAANIRTPAGLAYAPASDGSGVMRFYIVDRGIDNDNDPEIIDGKLYELTAPQPRPTFKVYLPLIEKN
jgi:uncharacterized protein YjiK